MKFIFKITILQRLLLCFAYINGISMSLSFRLPDATYGFDPQYMELMDLTKGLSDDEIETALGDLSFSDLNTLSQFIDKSKDDSEDSEAADKLENSKPLAWKPESKQLIRQKDAKGQSTKRRNKKFKDRKAALKKGETDDSLKDGESCSSSKSSSKCNDDDKKMIKDSDLTEKIRQLDEASKKSSHHLTFDNIKIDEKSWSKNQDDRNTQSDNTDDGAECENESDEDGIEKSHEETDEKEEQKHSDKERTDRISEPSKKHADDNLAKKSISPYERYTKSRAEKFRKSNTDDMELPFQKKNNINIDMSEIASPIGSAVQSESMMNYKRIMDFLRADSVESNSDNDVDITKTASVKTENNDSPEHSDQTNESVEVSVEIEPNNKEVAEENEDVEVNNEFDENAMNNAADSNLAENHETADNVEAPGNYAFNEEESFLESNARDPPRYVIKLNDGVISSETDDYLQKYDEETVDSVRLKRENTDDTYPYRTVNEDYLKQLEYSFPRDLDENNNDFEFKKDHIRVKRQ